MQIEKGIPIPTKRAGSVKYPFSVMEIGDSFLIARGSCKNPLSVAGFANKRHSPKGFEARTVNDGVRIWRTA